MNPAVISNGCVVAPACVGDGEGEGRSELRGDAFGLGDEAAVARTGLGLADLGAGAFDGDGVATAAEVARGAGDVAVCGTALVGIDTGVGDVVVGDATGDSRG